MLEAIRGLGPPEALGDELLVSSRTPRAIQMSNAPPSPVGSSPRVLVAVSEGATRPLVRGEGEEDTVFAGAVARLAGAATLGSAPDPAQRALPRRASEPPARSGVPAVGARAGGRHITVDPRRILGEKSELWTFSLDVHRHLSSLLSRIWKALRRSGAAIPAMTYGKEWVLFEPRTGRVLVEEQPSEGAAPKGLEAAGIRAGTILWVLRPEAAPPGVESGAVGREG